MNYMCEIIIDKGIIPNPSVNFNNMNGNIVKRYKVTEASHKFGKYNTSYLKNNH